MRLGLYRFKHQRKLPITRRCFMFVGALGLFGGFSATSLALQQPMPRVMLDQEQSLRCRAWMVRIANAQVAQGATPRWYHRDCAGLIRFVVAESLRKHDLSWQRANGITGRLPPEIQLTESQVGLRSQWLLPSGATTNFVGALALIQANTRLISKDLNQALPGDLLFFDQGDAQHLMFLMGRHVVYHRGSIDPVAHVNKQKEFVGSQHVLKSPPKNGVKQQENDPDLRSVLIAELMRWRDTRWQPVAHNPNFIGVFRLNFLI